MMPCSNEPNLGIREAERIVGMLSTKAAAYVYVELE
jgi:hypothetical protein